MDYWQNTMKGTLNGRKTIASTTLSLRIIIAIAVGGAFVLAVILGAIACFCARRRHGLKRRISEVDENGNEDILGIKDALSSIRPPEMAHRRRASPTPFIPLESFDNRGWIAHDPYFNPPSIKPRRHSSHKGFFKGSGMRDSWPLVTNIPLSIISNHTITPSQVAPPGYIVEDSKRPRRSSSLWAKKPGISQGSEPDPSSPTKSVKSANSSKSAPLLGSASPKFDPQFPPISAKRERSTTQRPKPHRRSTSETHLSTILRSTSQRLKAAQRNSLTRTLSTLGRAPVRRPSEKAPHPPVWAAAESREALIDKEYGEYLKNPLHGSFHNRTPSPVSLSPRPSQPLSRRTNSPTPDQKSPDSLCNIDTPELVIPAPLSLPSKQGLQLAEKRHRMRISSGEAKELAVLIHKDSQASILATGDQEEKKRLSVPHRTPFTGDPFYSSVRFSKSGIPKSLVPGERPLYICKATFGDEATSESSSSFSSPLGEVSYNIRTPPKESSTQESTKTQKLNPFQWSPQEAMQTRATQTSPKHTNAKRKGHKRSNVMRISNISRPTSVVEVVPEEPEDESTLTFFWPRNLPVRVSDSETSPSRRSNRGSGIRPPSSTVFNPTLNMSKLRPKSETDSAIFLRQSKELLSPTLSGNHYESSGRSEDELFAANRLDYNRHGRNYSSELQAYPTYQLQRELQQRLLGAQEELFYLPPPNISTAPPSSQPLPAITAKMTPLRSSLATPILTVPVPSHLTGPRAEPKKVARSSKSHVSTMPSTISMLRRMNSEISNHSPGSSPVTSPNLSSSFSSLNNISERTSKRIRGTKNYLSLGGNNSLLPRSNNRNSRDSHRISKDRRKNQRGDFELLDDDSDDEKESIFVDKNILTPVKEVSSPVISTSSINKNQQGSYLRFPTLNREGSTQPTPESSPKHKSQFQFRSPTSQSSHMQNFQVQLSSAASQIESEHCGHGNHQSPVYIIPPKNPKRLSVLTPTLTSHVISRESRIEHLSPGTPVSALGMGISGLRLMKKGKGGLNLDSPGLYDEKGFLMGSPDREKFLRIMENKN